MTTSTAPAVGAVLAAAVLFGIVSAVVVDSGDVASHPGIAAREYGIPCVLATNVATATIPDGATIEVDGDAGTVRLLRS